MFFVRKVKKVVITYLIAVGIAFNVLMLIGMAGTIIGGVMIYQSYQLPPHVFFQRVSQSMAKNNSPLINLFSPAVEQISLWLSPEHLMKRVRVSGHEKMIGANSIHSNFFMEQAISDHRIEQHYQQLLAVDKGRFVMVNDSRELLSALNQAEPGDTIIMNSGEYLIEQNQVYFKASGTAKQPIALKALNYGAVKISLNSREGFVITGDHWVVENLVIDGACQKHSSCEHAFHIVGASHAILRNNKISNFNSLIKANGKTINGHRQYPDNILLEQNTLYNDSPRNTSSAVTHVDVVAGNDWIIRRNFISSNSKNGSDKTSYAAFLKGNSSNGLFEQNIIDCDLNLPFDQSTRIGLSLGGGGTGQDYCREGVCEAEHKNGTIKDNLIVNCQQDVGIYLNKASNSHVIHNTLINNLGMDIRYSISSALVMNNQISGAFRSRDDGKITLEDNEIIALDDLSQASTKSESNFDLCGYKRARFSSFGALTKACQKQINITTEILK